MFQIKKRYNFSTIAPSILGGEYKNMLVEAIMSAEEAIKHYDIMTMHEQVRTLVHLNMEANVCTYVKFKTLDGAVKIIPIEYINSDSIKEVQNVNIRIELQRATTTDLLVIKERLQELGYKEFEITTY